MLPRPPRSTLFPYTTLFRSTCRRDPSCAFASIRLFRSPTLAETANTKGTKGSKDTKCQKPNLVSCPSSSSCASCLCLRSEEHTSELQSLAYLVCRLLLEKKN